MNTAVYVTLLCRAYPFTKSKGMFLFSIIASRISHSNGCVYSDVSFPAFTGFPAFMQSKFPHFLFIFSPFWRLLAQIHAFFQAVSFRSAYTPVLNQGPENLTVFGYSLIIMNTPL